MAHHLISPARTVKLKTRCYLIVAIAIGFGCLVAGSVAPAASAAEMVPVGGTLREQVGVNIHFTRPQPGEMDMLAAAGFGFIRMDFAWGAIEKQPGVYDFSAYDGLLSQLDQRHMRALFILDYGNSLYDNGMAPHTDEGRAAFARFAVAAATRYKGRRIVWEMWNEPNGEQFWKSTVNVDDYVKLAVVVGKALRDSAPNEAYIGPALAGTNPKFLDVCFENGALEYWQAVSVHPYRNAPPEQAAQDIQRLQALIAKYAQAGKTIPLLSGEWGWSVRGKYASVDSDAVQAAYFDRQVLNNLTLGIPLSIWYDWRDDNDNPSDTEGNFGLVHHPYHAGGSPVYDPKPAYVAAKTLLTLLGDYTYDRQLTAIESNAAHAVSFSRKKDRRYAAWTTASTPPPVTLPVPPGKYTIVDISGNVVSAATAGAAGLPITLTGDTQFVLPGDYKP